MIPFQLGLRMFSGMRPTDVDLERAKNTAIRERLYALLRGRRGVMPFERLFIPDVEKLPESLQPLGMFQQKFIRESQAKARKLKKESEAPVATSDFNRRLVKQLMDGV